MQFDLTGKIAPAFLLCFFALTMATPSISAEQPKIPPANAETTINEKELNAFIKAYVDYQKIRANYGSALERATDSQEKKRIEQEANTRVKRSLDAQGLSSERYNKIFATVNNNPELRQKVLKKVEDERKKS